MNLLLKLLSVKLLIKKLGFGKFSLKVTIISYLIYLNLTVGIISTGFVLPAAACHLKMNIVDKGLITTAFFVGSCFSAVISGFLANLKGRKWILLVALFLQGNSDILQSLLSNYWIMFGLKFLSGVGSAGQNIVFTYLSECLPIKNRSFILSNMEFFCIFGHAFAAAVGLGIIPLKFDIENNYFSFHSWNLYIIICSLPSFILGFCLIFLPETPKYLAECGSREKLLQVLIEMYEQNNGKSGKEYIKILLNSENSALIELTHKNKEENNNFNKENILIRKICNELKQLMCIFKKPFLKNTLFACFTAFTITSSFYALYLWLPEIFQRFATFDAKNKGKNSNFCTISKDTFSSIQNMHGCDTTIDKKVFINNLILCSSCIPTIIIATLLVKRFGLKILLVLWCILCMAVTIGIYFSNSFYQNLILLCLYLSFTSTSVTLQFAYFVSIFPTNFRSSGVIATSLLVRIGAVFGNFTFSFLKDYCLYFIILICLLLLVAAISTILISERKDE
ncbi:synaptic vesicle glycoprotein 2B-like isoform X2 [Leptopilina boulardi]|uniref:synaptic vesicle glycoprotein 2B-like isoform X2 n=1 Tax=Leptopilina boulardi TaxID=63433 RepID=UPI0021F609C1|nr:synaptic vesicle glycoprotein 2B-like isoform X2 [Leptopilina boulardi]